MKTKRNKRYVRKVWKLEDSFGGQFKMAPVQILPTWATCMGTQGVCEGMRVSVFQLLDVILIVLIQPMLLSASGQETGIHS